MSPAAHGTVQEFDHLPESWETFAHVPRRPIGVAVLSALIAAASMLAIVGAAFFLVSQYLGGATPSSVLPAPFDFAGILAGPFGAMITLVVGGVGLGVATSLWRQEVWALWTITAFAFAGVAYLVVMGSFTVLLVLLGILVVYMLAVRRYFY
ncbi:MAG: hypothetical protein WAN74_05505 [Thermoplasmata archaeon]